MEDIALYYLRKGSDIFSEVYMSVCLSFVSSLHLSPGGSKLQHKGRKRGDN